MRGGQRDHAQPSLADQRRICKQLVGFDFAERYWFLQRLSGFDFYLRTFRIGRVDGDNGSSSYGTLTLAGFLNH